MFVISLSISKENMIIKMEKKSQTQEKSVPSDTGFTIFLKEIWNRQIQATSVLPMNAK